MTQAQLTAITNPCIVAEDCTKSIYKRYLKPRWSVILTCNVGFE